VTLPPLRNQRATWEPKDVLPQKHTHVGICRKQGGTITVRWPHKWIWRTFHASGYLSPDRRQHRHHRKDGDETYSRLDGVNRLCLIHGQSYTAWLLVVICGAVRPPFSPFRGHPAIARHPVWLSRTAFLYSCPVPPWRNGEQPRKACDSIDTYACHQLKIIALLTVRLYPVFI